MVVLATTRPCLRTLHQPPQTPYANIFFIFVFVSFTHLVLDGGVKMSTIKDSRPCWDLTDPNAVGLCCCSGQCALITIMLAAIMGMYSSDIPLILPLNMSIVTGNEARVILPSPCSEHSPGIRQCGRGPCGGSTWRAGRQRKVYRAVLLPGPVKTSVLPHHGRAAMRFSVMSSQSLGKDPAAVRSF